MCLGIPGMIVKRWVQDDGAIAAEVDFAGERRIVLLNYLPDLDVGDYTIVHAGYALTRLEPSEAAETLRVMREAGVVE
jgi:hydrogenase expression/formation protein HypC